MLRRLNLLNILGNLINPATYDAQVDGSQRVGLVDQFTEVIDLHMGQLIQSFDLTANTVLDQQTITITAASEPTNGHVVCLKEGQAFYQGEILSHSANGPNWDIELDSPLDYPYTTAGGCTEKNINLAVNGSVSPVEFTVSPGGLADNVAWDITRLIITITDDVIMDDSKFGGISALPKGIVVRVTDGYTKNIFNAKTNQDVGSHMYDLIYSDKAPAGSYGLKARRTFAGQDKNGVTVRLNADNNDELKVIVQDDLRGLITFHAICQGHVTED